ncbi:hypothetical protein AB0L88_33995 [Saccharopolyspora shandongensis]|uniref:hypothetical protein n=1 Tax=Saccharopolyspora shandongensis TaxID=418495 RepID=UPI003447FCE2
MLLFLAGMVPVLALLVLVAWRMYVAEPAGQHTGGSEGALTVAHLLRRVERERSEVENTGRHALRENVAARIATIVGTV